MPEKSEPFDPSKELGIDPHQESVPGFDDMAVRPIDWQCPRAPMPDGTTRTEITAGQTFNYDEDWDK